MLLDILNKIDPTSESVKRSTRSDGKLPSQQIAMPQPRQQRHTDGDSKACSRMPLARPTVIKPTDFAFALEALAVNQVRLALFKFYVSPAERPSVSRVGRLHFFAYGKSSFDIPGAELAPTIPDTGKLGKCPV